MDIKPVLSCPEIEVGGNYFVKQKTNDFRPAVVLENRINSVTGVLECYVHYESTDHRLDEWVNADCVESRSATEPSTSVNFYLIILRLGLLLLESVASSGIFSFYFQGSKVKRIEKIIYGDYLIHTWYHSPYPKEYEDCTILYVCDHCLKYMMYDYTYVKHRRDCRRIHPPGKEIYRDGSFVLYEVHGNHARAKVPPTPYCQCLCYLAKLFIDQKTIFCDLDSFMFYVLCEDQKSSMVGYFSKETGNIDDYNLACICILPPFQRTGYGKLLIQFSYELSRREGIVGSPEKPLSDLGKYSYQSYWSWALLEVLKRTKKITLEELSKTTGIHEDDIVACLTDLHMTKYWKGTPWLRITKTAVEKCYRNGVVKKPRIVLKPNLLHWKAPQFLFSSRTLDLL
ncbi:unnamed protein product [Enterobius vermicularis]|uniref:histone acetyltransferase n=1 Tax=Enterobius vermicularis TaxID=51028 RepID=A0A0N4V3R6_ENTVE|nr:unnamed protein product [Enterobius vermicularis]